VILLQKSACVGILLDVPVALRRVGVFRITRQHG
jgi:hypothetical protein